MHTYTYVHTCIHPTQTCPCQQPISILQLQIIKIHYSLKGHRWAYTHTHTYIPTYIHTYIHTSYTGVPLPTARYNLAAAEHKDRLFAIGGTNGYGTLSAVEMFDGVKWTEESPMLFPRQVCMYACMYVYGILMGSNGQKNLQCCSLDWYVYVCICMHACMCVHVYGILMAEESPLLFPRQVCMYVCMYMGFSWGQMDRGISNVVPETGMHACMYGCTLTSSSYDTKACLCTYVCM